MAIAYAIFIAIVAVALASYKKFEVLKKDQKKKVISIIMDSADQLHVGKIVRFIPVVIDILLAVVTAPAAGLLGVLGMVIVLTEEYTKVALRISLTVIKETARAAIFFAAFFGSLFIVYFVGSAIIVDILKGMDGYIISLVVVLLASTAAFFFGISILVVTAFAVYNIMKPAVMAYRAVKAVITKRVVSVKNDIVNYNYGKKANSIINSLINSQFIKEFGTTLILIAILAAIKFTVMFVLAAVMFFMTKQVLTIVDIIDKAIDDIELAISDDITFSTDNINVIETDISAIGTIDTTVTNTTIDNTEEPELVELFELQTFIIPDSKLPEFPELDLGNNKFAVEQKIIELPSFLQNKVVTKEGQIIDYSDKQGRLF